MAAESANSPAPVWRKSLASDASDACVEVAIHKQSVLVRDSRNRSGVILAVTPGSWRELLARIRNGELDCGLSAGNLSQSIQVDDRDVPVSSPD